jgi:uncharacterized protein (DUF952 family)
MAAVSPGKAEDLIVYKIVPNELWQASESSGVFTGSPIDLDDGFIHLSTGRQLHDTAARHFAGISGLLLVAVTIEALDVRWEPSRGGDLFPHLYGALPWSAVRWVAPLTVGSDGRHTFPDGIR